MAGNKERELRDTERLSPRWKIKTHEIVLTSILVHMHAGTHAHTHTYIHTHAHTHMYTHSQIILLRKKQEAP